MTDEEMMQELKSKSLLNQARKIFSDYQARIANEMEQGMTPVEMRRMEFEAVQKIWRLYDEARRR